VKTTLGNDRSTPRVAVVTPVVKLPLSAEEEISMRHLREHLGRFDRYIIGLQRLPKAFSDFTLLRLPARYFTDRFGYNRLILTKEFYRAFAAYEFLLIYQLDSLVFANNLEYWCRKGWDYVGAPWLIDTEDPQKGFSVVGNGGFSLRRVQSAIDVLTSKQFLEDPKTRGLQTGPRSKLIHERLESTPLLKRIFVAGKTLLHRSGYHNNVRWLVRDTVRTQRHEDHFWAYDAWKVVKQFRIPSPREALEFSFEVAPRYCFEVNDARLPFGCHAWFRYDREFWEPFLLK
jgi:Protein of unknown function (DUF5672)